MQTWISILISGVSMAFAVFFGLIGFGRQKRRDAEEDTARMTAMIVKLENISSGITEIKSEMSGMKMDIKDIRERLVVAEQSTISAHKRIDELVKATETC